jgi:hypothetical protein
MQPNRRAAARGPRHALPTAGAVAAAVPVLVRGAAAALVEAAAWGAVRPWGAAVAAAVNNDRL